MTRPLPLRRPSEDKVDEKFIIVWTIDGETMSIAHPTQDQALHLAKTLLREHGCDLEITLHLGKAGLGKRSNN